MRLDRVPAGGRIFIDANIFIYHFTGVFAPILLISFSLRSEAARGLTGVHILAEVAHRLMMIEAVRRALRLPAAWRPSSRAS